MHLPEIYRGNREFIENVNNNNSININLKITKKCDEIKIVGSK
jgi:hypothetical protein